MENFHESKLVLKGLKENKDYLEMRERELEEIKKVSSRVVSITVSMSIDVEKQKNTLSKFILNYFILK